MSPVHDNLSPPSRRALPQRLSRYVELELCVGAARCMAPAALASALGAQQISMGVTAAPPLGMSSADLMGMRRLIQPTGMLVAPMAIDTPHSRPVSEWVWKASPPTSMSTTCSARMITSTPMPMIDLWKLWKMSHSEAERKGKHERGRGGR